MMPTSESPIIQFCTLGYDTTAGKKGSEKRTNPYVPIFSRTPARMTEPAVGASTCASGSHVWNGNIGTFTANAMKNAKKSQIPACGAIRADDKMASYEKFGMFVAGSDVCSPRYTIAASISIEPTIV